MLSFAVSGQRFQLISQWDSEFLKHGDGIQLVRLSERLFIEQVFHGFVASSRMMVGAASYGLFFLKPRRMIELVGKDI
jgi:hypothetical protein